MYGGTSYEYVDISSGCEIMCELCGLKSVQFLVLFNPELRSHCVLHAHYSELYFLDRKFMNCYHRFPCYPAKNCVISMQFLVLASEVVGHDSHF